MPQKVLVVGGGKYGVKAIEHFKKDGFEVHLMDPDPDCPGKDLADVFHQVDTSVVYEKYIEIDPVWMVPTAPVHVAALLIKQAFGDLEPDLDNAGNFAPFEGYFNWPDGANVYISNLSQEQLCLDDCIGCKSCPVRANDREHFLSELLETRGLIVVISKQMGGGLGAVSGDNIERMLEMAKDKSQFGLATSCTCHAVVTFYKR